MESMNLPAIFTPDIGLLFWMLLAFLVVFFFLAKFGFPAIVNMVEERKNFIDESLKAARAANEKLADIEAESERLLQNAREKQASILKEAAATRDAIIEEAKSKADAESVRILEEAKAQIQVEKDNALRDIRRQVADLSVEIAEKLIHRQLDDELKQETLINSLLDEMNNSPS